LPQVLRIGREIAEGLAGAHARGLVHRDIKPANVWLERGRDRVKIVDFGLARGTGEDAHFTQAGAVIGTPAYMAPEQANGVEVDARCDLFSLGAVLYRAGTGQLPFGGKDTLSVMRALATTTPAPPHKLTPSLPRAFSGLVMRLLAEEPEDRPQSARDVVEALAAIERGEEAEPIVPQPAPAADEVREEAAAETEGKRRRPKRARPSPARRKKRPEAARNWGGLVLAASLVLLGVAVLVLLAALLLRASRARTVAGPVEDRPALMGTLNGPKFLWVKKAGTVLIADTDNHCIRRCAPGPGTLTIVAGTGKRGRGAAGGRPTDTALDQPHGVAVDPDGVLYISDSLNHRILKVAP
jgi:hypothetical protein